MDKKTDATLTEAVAVAICKANLQLPYEYTASGNVRWELFVRQAQAAIHAIEAHNG